MSTKKRVVSGGSLEPSHLPVERRIPKLVINGEGETSGEGGSGSTGQSGAGIQELKSPQIIEISEDGSFELPDDDLPPELDEPPGFAGIAAAVQPPTMPPQAVPPEEEGPSLMEQMMADANAARKIVKDKAEAEEKRVKKEFGSGMKKGFFNSAPAGKKAAVSKKTTKTSSTPKASIPTVRAASPAALKKEKEDGLVIGEVQDAMKDAAAPMAKALAKGDWMTPDLLKKFATNPKLARGLVDPRFQAALQELQRDPKAAMLKFQADKELTAFLQEFCQTMGEHFGHIGEQQEKEKQKQAQQAAAASPAEKKTGKGTASSGTRGDDKGVPTVPDRPLSDAAMKRAETANGGTQLPAVSPEEQAQMDSILRNQELRELLMDPGMQQVMQKCQEPGRLQFFMNDPKWGPKIRKLAEFGLVRFER